MNRVIKQVVASGDAEVIDLGLTPESVCVFNATTLVKTEFLSADSVNTFGVQIAVDGAVAACTVGNGIELADKGISIGDAVAATDDVLVVSASFGTE